MDASSLAQVADVFLDAGLRECRHRVVVGVERHAFHQGLTENFAMNSWSFRRAILALVIGLGVVAGLVRGQDTRPMPSANGAVPAANSPAVVAIQYAPPGVYPEVQSKQPGMLEHLNRH